MLLEDLSTLFFTAIVHAFICCCIDYCNSLLASPAKVRLSSLQSVLNSAARLIAHHPRFSHISTYVIDELHWFPIASQI